MEPALSNREQDEAKPGGAAFLVSRDSRFGIGGASMNLKKMAIPGALTPTE